MRNLESKRVRQTKSDISHSVIPHFVLSNGEGKLWQWVRHRDLLDKEELNIGEAIGKVSGYLI